MMSQNLSIVLLWLLLMVLTALTALFAESYAATVGLVALVLSVTVIKAKVLVDSFMGLRHAPPMWRWLLLAYTPVIGLIVTLTYLF